jgi:hypothetical protein
MPTPWNLDAAAPQAAYVPALAHDGDQRIYRDSQDSSRLCIDALEPHARSTGLQGAGAGPRSGRAARPVCAAFGPSEAALRRVHALFTEHRATPLAWLSGPFFAWARKAGGVHLIDHGETVGGRGPEARVCGRQPDGVELTQAVAAAELLHWGRLHCVTIKATARPGVATSVRESVRIGRRAAWTSTLADALAAVLTDLVRRDRLQITVASGPLPLRAFEEVREMVVMEWARRLAGTHPLSLPAAQLSGLIHDRGVDLTIDWRDGDRVPLRVVRSLRYESLAADSARSLGWGLAAVRSQPGIARA